MICVHQEIARERQENLRLVRLMQDKEEMIGKLKEEIDLLNRVSISAFRCQGVGAFVFLFVLFCVLSSWMKAWEGGEPVHCLVGFALQLIKQTLMVQPLVGSHKLSFSPHLQTTLKNCSALECPSCLKLEASTQGAVMRRDAIGLLF